MGAYRDAYHEVRGGVRLTGSDRSERPTEVQRGQSDALTGLVMEMKKSSVEQQVKLDEIHAGLLRKLSETQSILKRYSNQITDVAAEFTKEKAQWLSDGTPLHVKEYILTGVPEDEKAKWLRDGLLGEFILKHAPEDKKREWLHDGMPPGAEEYVLAKEKEIDKLRQKVGQEKKEAKEYIDCLLMMLAEEPSRYAAKIQRALQNVAFMEGTVVDNKGGKCYLKPDAKAEVEYRLLLIFGPSNPDVNTEMQRYVYKDLLQIKERKYNLGKGTEDEKIKTMLQKMLEELKEKSYFPTHYRNDLETMLKDLEGRKLRDVTSLRGFSDKEISEYKRLEENLTSTSRGKKVWEKIIRLPPGKLHGLLSGQLWRQVFAPDYYRDGGKKYKTYTQHHMQRDLELDSQLEFLILWDARELGHPGEDKGILRLRKEGPYGTARPLDAQTQIAQIMFGFDGRHDVNIGRSLDTQMDYLLTLDRIYKHLGILAPSGSGKSTLIKMLAQIVPGSLFLSDTKNGDLLGDLLSSLERTKAILILGDNAHYNLFGNFPYEVKGLSADKIKKIQERQEVHAKQLARIWCSGILNGGKNDPLLSKMAEEIFAASIIHLRQERGIPPLAELGQFLTNGQWLGELERSPSAVARKLRNEMDYRLFEMVARDNGARFGLLHEALGAVATPMNVGIIANKSVNNFIDLGAMLREPTALFAPDMLQNLPFTLPYRQLMLQQALFVWQEIYDEFAMKNNQVAKDLRDLPPLQIGIILDELATHGYIQDLGQYMATLRFLGIWFLLAAQNQERIIQLYGPEASAVIDNQGTVIYLGGTTHPDAEHASEKAGKGTAQKRVEQMVERNMSFLRDIMKGTAEEQANILNADEIARLPFGYAVVLPNVGMPSIVNLRDPGDPFKGKDKDEKAVKVPEGQTYRPIGADSQTPELVIFDGDCSRLFSEMKKEEQDAFMGKIEEERLSVMFRYKTRSARENNAEAGLTEEDIKSVRELSRVMNTMAAIQMQNKQTSTVTGNQ